MRLSSRLAPLAALKRFMEFLTIAALLTLGLLGGHGASVAHAETSAHAPGTYGVNVSTATFFDGGRT